MKIWVIGRSYPTKQNKMRGSFELEQAQMLASHGHEVSYLALIMHPLHKIKRWGFCHFADGGVDVFTESVFFAPERMHLHSKIAQHYFWSKLFRAAQAEHGLPDVIHIHYPGMNCIPSAVLPYQQQGVKIVTTEHWTKVLNHSMDAYQRRQLIAFSQIADEMVSVGYPLKRAIEEITATQKQIHVVPNIVSNYFAPEEKQQTGFYDFIAVGRLAPVKQIDQIAAAFGRAFAGKKQVRLTIVGGGTDRQKIETEIAACHMEDQVRLMGTLSREETAKAVAQSDCLICFSRLETFGVPVIEAWACGKPVIASDALGFLEYWQNELGEIVSMHSPAELEDAMKKMYESREKYDSKFLSNFANHHFSEDAVCRQLMSVYEKA